jgi:hypothetical protein
VAVFVDEPAEHIGSFDAPKLFDLRGRRFCRRDGYIEVDAAVRAGGVVVPDVVG